jgi:hypothetical protein
MVLVWLGALIASPGQSSSAFGPYRGSGEVAPPPASGVLDQAGMLSRNPVLLAKLTSQIQQLKADHGFQIYLVLESVLVSESVQQAATRLQEAWLPEGNGMVLVFELDSRMLGLGQAYGQNLDESPKPAQVPSYESMAILTAATKGLDRNMPSEPFLETVTTRLVEHYNAYFKRKEAPVPEGRTLRLGLILIGGASALALIGLIVALIMKRSTGAMAGGALTLPETGVSERLGAPYGAAVSSHRFGAGAKEQA